MKKYIYLSISILFIGIITSIYFLKSDKKFPIPFYIYHVEQKEMLKTGVTMLPVSVEAGDTINRLIKAVESDNYITFQELTIEPEKRYFEQLHRVMSKAKNEVLLKANNNEYYIYLVESRTDSGKEYLIINADKKSGKFILKNQPTGIVSSILGKWRANEQWKANQKSSHDSIKFKHESEFKRYVFKHKGIASFEFAGSYKVKSELLPAKYNQAVNDRVIEPLFIILGDGANLFYYKMIKPENIEFNILHRNDEVGFALLTKSDDGDVVEFEQNTYFDGRSFFLDNELLNKIKNREL
ncbi:hypothetical protein [Kangiella sp.]|uniref:hypothetical protein n=1 Tax=Kangiella sp. TaxID=1920245 RepID=UPI0019B958F2|nr:hypothetical protein [Kangiella sp.]MBD3652369.1 hypothetical protein [Kangiella sp.]